MVAVPVDQPADQVALSGEGEGCDDDEEGDIYILMQCLCARSEPPARPCLALPRPALA